MKQTLFVATFACCLIAAGKLNAQGMYRQDRGGPVSFEKERTATLFVKTIISQEKNGVMKVRVFNSSTGEEFNLFVRSEDVIQISKDVWIVDQDLGLKDL